jgi:hypothetical protein
MIEGHLHPEAGCLRLGSRFLEPSSDGSEGKAADFSSPPREWGRGLRRVSRSEAETYSELGEGDIAGKNGVFDIPPVIEAPLT